MVSKRKQLKSRSPKPHKWELVVVEWEDAAFGENHDFSEGEILEPIKLRTVGFIVSRTKKYLTIAGEYNPDDNSTRHQWTILRGNIKKLINLGEV